MKKHTKSLITAGVAAALLSTAFSASAGRDVMLQFTGVNFFYDPMQTFNDIGLSVNPDNYPAPGRPPLMDIDNDGFDDATGQSMAFKVIRDGVQNDGYSPTTYTDNGDGTFTPNTTYVTGGATVPDGKADSTFGELEFATPVSSYKVFEKDEFGLYSIELGEYSTQPLALDFRMVIDPDTNGDGVVDALDDVPAPGAGQAASYTIATEYSYFDILTQDGGLLGKDWGLAVDSIESGVLNVSNTGVSQLVFTALSANIFDDGTGESNNLPYPNAEVLEPITFSFSFQSSAAVGGLSDVSFVGSGTGEVTYSIPEPSSIALWGLALAGLGFYQRKRTMKK